MKTIKKFTALILLCTLIFSCSKKDTITIDKNLIPLSADFNLNFFDNVLFTADNGLLIAGSYNHKSTIIKTNYRFEIEWTKNGYEWGNMGSSGTGWGSSFYSIKVVKMFQRNDGSYVCIGSIMEGGDVVFQSALVIVLNQQGEQIHQYEFKDIAVSNALRTSDGGYVLFGNVLIKLDANFNQKWENSIPDYDYWKTQIITTADGGFAITGYKGDLVFLKKFDLNGKEISVNTYKHNDFAFDEVGYDLVQLSDKGFLIIGRTGKTFAPYNLYYQMIRTNAVGDTIWTKQFGDSTNEWLERFVSSGNNEFVLLGSIGFPNEPQKSVLFRVNSDGQILNSVEFEKFQLMVYSPLMFYIKIKNSDAEHINFTKIESGKLFN
jgi:hypothetical protein